MLVFQNKASLSSHISKLKSENKTIGFVPTMGFLHEGHLALVKKAKECCDVVVVSIFVNPTQFGPNEDLDSYPRDLERDKQLLEEIDTDILFFPSVDEMYKKDSIITINPSYSEKVLCGRFRENHFSGVLTVVIKLFNITMANYAFFGKKDAQQLLIIEKMVDDLDINIKIVPVETIREVDGLAKSSRNTYLSSKEREEATIIFKSFEKAKHLILNKETDVQIITEAIKSSLQSVDCSIQYIEAINIKTFKNVDIITSNTLFAVAAYFGQTRLIDNFFVKDIIGE